MRLNGEETSAGEPTPRASANVPALDRSGSNPLSRQLAVHREFSAERINAIVNHSEVRPWVGGGTGTLDLTGIVADPRNVLLMAELGGLVFIELEPGLMEVHTQFLPEGRGASAITAVNDALWWIFTRTACTEVVTKVPAGNMAAAALVKRIGGRLRFRRENAWHTATGTVPVSYYSKTLDDWAADADGLDEIGHWFHEKLEHAKEATTGAAPLHDDDAAHDRYVGATVAMIAAEHLAKGLGFYGRWAKLAGYGPIAAIATNPLVLDIGDALLAVHGDDFDVILCR
jgi:hypothetical protein